MMVICFFFSSRRRHTRFDCDWSSDVCSSDLRDLGRHTVGGRRRQIISSPQLYARTIVFKRWSFEVQIARSPEIATEISRSEQRYSSRDLVPHVGLAGETVLVSDNAFSGERTLRSFSLYRDVPKTAIPNVSDSF